jgi:ribosomal protein S18 acetylase RimI-like enzyme
MSTSNFKYRTKKLAKSSKKIDDVVDLEWLCYGPESITKKEIVVLMDQGYYLDVIESVTEKKIVGAIIYLLGENKVHIASLSVHPEFERLGIGSKMLASVSAKMSKLHSCCYVYVPESVIETGEFLTKNGFLPTKNSCSVRNGKTYFLFSLDNPFFSEIQLVTKNEV